MKTPAYWAASLYARTDGSRPVFFFVNSNFTKAENNRSQYFTIGPGLSTQPFGALKLSLEANYSANTDQLQYVDTKMVNNNPRYILGTIDQKTLGFTFKVDYIITPEMSLQYYGSPFASIGKYKELKIVTNPKANGYHNRFSMMNPDLTGDNYVVDENNDGQPEYTFKNPDFNFYQLRSNLVFRWEFRPGSQLYLVWSSDRTENLNPGNYGINDMGNRISGTFPNNIFLIKFNYWFSL